MATQEYPSPSRSASGQLNANAGARQRATGQQPSLFANRPLPTESPAAAYARATEQQQQPPQAAPQSYVAQPAQTAAYGQQVPTAYGQPTQTAAYGQPSYAVSPPATAPTATGKAAKAGRTSPTPSQQQPARKTRQTQTVPVQTGSSWQAALPVSPWSTYERQSGPVTGLETETVLRSDLKALKRSRTRARLYLGGVLVVSALVIHFGLRTMEQNATRYKQLSKAHEALQAQVAGSIVPDLGRLPSRQGSRPLAASAPAASPGGGATSTSTRALADDLRRQLEGDAAINVETRGDRVIVAVDDTSLFAGNGAGVGPGGFRVLFRFGKALKNVRDRRIVVTVVASEGARPRPWFTAASRGIALGRFLIDDLSVESNRVVIAAPAPKSGGTPGAKDRVEFALEPMT